MHRFYLPPEEACGEVLYLAGREAHHALHVLRLRDGDPIIVLNGVGQEIHAQLTRHDRDKIKLHVLQRRDIPAPSSRITLFQSIPKGKLLESVIQKATELGVSRIVPVISERVVSHVTEAKVPTKADKWHLVAIEAIKQCGQTWLPEVTPPATIPELLARTEPFELPLIASLQPGSRHPREYFETFRRQHSRNPKNACVWVGPEGDFTETEVRQIMETGAKPISLGPLVLRVETAATYCLSILAYELQQT